MTKVADLAQYREENAERLRFENEEFGEVIDSFKQVRVFWYGYKLELHLDADSRPEYVARIRKNPARGLALFGTVRFLGQDHGIRASIAYIVNFKFLQKTVNGVLQNVLIVEYRSSEPSARRIIIGKKELKKSPIRYMFA